LANRGRVLAGKVLCPSCGNRQLLMLVGGFKAFLA